MTVTNILIRKSSTPNSLRKLPNTNCKFDLIEGGRKLVGTLDKDRYGQWIPQSVEEEVSQSISY